MSWDSTSGDKGRRASWAEDRVSTCAGPFSETGKLVLKCRGSVKELPKDGKVRWNRILEDLEYQDNGKLMLLQDNDS